MQQQNAVQGSADLRLVDRDHDETDDGPGTVPDCVECAALFAQGAVSGGDVGIGSLQDRLLFSCQIGFTGRTAVGVIETEPAGVVNDSGIDIGHRIAVDIQLLHCRGIRISTLDHGPDRGKLRDIGGALSNGTVHQLTLIGNIYVQGNKCGEKHQKQGKPEEGTVDNLLKGILRPAEQMHGVLPWKRYGAGVATAGGKRVK